ncbi:MAG: PLD nuclease N-terminal domain-containing protein [Oryzomonas sp.]|uniref:PLD nuclease N-terminal domain-containing protein n=1 Tax=Oryzomonas sp. TaxID=2855186 RepID=UPI0028464482|nr:PLD nuclease N-terminal domain-containing protein [Oryzomonas sp.]MDR3581024.1 PLD nuclease N-terminal domain-containing protein [Oryzomonas sp.]
MTLIMLLTVIALITLPSIIWLYALTDAIINTFKTFGIKIIWILALCFFPPVGTVLYYLIGRNQRRTYYPVGRLVLVFILILPIIMTIAYYLQSPEPETNMEPSAPSKAIQI